MSTTMSSLEVATLAGITYRQLDYWTSQGYLKARSGLANPGSGKRREYTERQANIAEAMARLVRDGLAPDRAAKAARALVGRGHTTLGGALLQSVRSS